MKDEQNPMKGSAHEIEPDEFCDFDSPNIRAQAKELTQDAKDATEAAVNIFYFVRDRIKFALTPFGKKASRVLEEKQGFCVSCANLQIALCRAAGIEARYHLAVADKRVFKGILPWSIYALLPPGISPHAWCEVCLDGTWLAAETVYDRPFYEGLLQKGIVDRAQIPSIDWDGSKDCLTQSQHFWLRKDAGITETFPNTPMLNAVSVLGPYFLLNRYLERIRSG